MDWNKQAEEMLKTWTTSQQKMWDSWFKTMQTIGTSQAGDTWEKSIDTWKDSVKQALDAQTRWTQFWVESMTSGSGVGKPAAEWSTQMLEMTKRWSETQNQLWDNWFDTMKKSDPTAMAKNWNTDELQKIVQVWQETAQKTMEAQMEWTRMMTQAQKADKVS